MIFFFLRKNRFVFETSYTTLRTSIDILRKNKDFLWEIVDKNYLNFHSQFGHMTIVFLFKKNFDNKSSVFIKSGVNQIQRGKIKT